MTPEQVIEQALEAAGMVVGDPRILLVEAIIKILPGLLHAYCQQRGLVVVAQTVEIIDERGPA